MSKEDRDKAKRITYGLIYGLSAFGLAQVCHLKCVLIRVHTQLHLPHLP